MKRRSPDPRTPTSLTRIGRARKQPRDGAVAQMGERCNRTAEVRGSNSPQLHQEVRANRRDFLGPQNSTTFPRLVAAAVGLPSQFHRLCGSLAARGVENLWPQNSVSKVAVASRARFEPRLVSNLDHLGRVGWEDQLVAGK